MTLCSLFFNVIDRKTSHSHVDCKHYYNQLLQASVATSIADVDVTH